MNEQAKPLQSAQELLYISDAVKTPLYLKQATIERPESPDEMVSRLRREEADARIQRWKEFALFVFAVLITFVIVGVCLWIIYDKSATPDMKTGAFSLLSALMTGIIGYICGKAQK
jgi:hypothetical protein